NATPLNRQENLEGSVSPPISVPWVSRHDLGTEIEFRIYTLISTAAAEMAGQVEWGRMVRFIQRVSGECTQSALELELRELGIAESEEDEWGTSTLQDDLAKLPGPPPELSLIPEVYVSAPTLPAPEPTHGQETQSNGFSPHTVPSQLGP